ncbi:MAG: metal-binding protein [Gammaproteobacteria bacterium]|nr:metal-binding protein [Gammaproteobacteria bacterium]
MKIDMRKKVNNDKNHDIKVILEDRLPSFVIEPIEMTFSYEVEKEGPLNLLTIHEKAYPKIQCQRCMEECSQPFEHTSQIAICSSDEIAQQYQSSYDLIVASDFILEINDILIDDLHLYLPNFHKKIDQCHAKD